MRSEAPYAVCGGHVIYHLPALELLELLDGAGVDAVLTDPPYGLDDGLARVQTHSGKRVEAWQAGFPDELQLDWLLAAHRALRPGGACVVWTDAKEITTLWRACKRVGLHPLAVVAWHKSNPPPHPRKSFRSALELAVFARAPGRVAYWEGQPLSVVHLPLVHHTRRVHPTQKPEALWLWLLAAVVRPGGVAVDPFAGSGSLMLAAQSHGRRSIVGDIDEQWCEIMVARYRERYPAGHVRLRKRNE